MFLAKAAQHSLHTLFEPPYRTHSQNQKTESHHHLKNGDDHDQDDFTRSPLSDFLHHPRTPAEFEELEEEENAKMSRNSNNGKRHKNHAGHKASKHRKNNKGNKANNSHSGHHNNKHRGGRNNNRAIRGTGEGWYAVAAMQGRRPHMEDTYHVLVPDASGPAAGDLHSLFGVFDGHGGKKVAQYLKENLLPAIVEAYANEKEVDGNDPNQQRTPTERLQAILPRTFLEIDEQCMADDRLSGSTAVVAILTETDIVVANVGDSRGIIYRTNEPSGRKSASRARSNDDDDDCPSDASLDSAPSEDDATDDDNYTDTDNDTDEEFVTDDEDDVHVKGKAKQAPGQEEGAKKKEKKKKRKYRKKPEEGDVGKTGRWQALSVDHKPNRPDERDRVEQAGGRVSKRPNDVWRFQNVLAVSRAFGDHGLKAGPGGAGLTANPEIKVFPRQDSDKFFVLASDGLWDVYTNEQAARVGRNALLQSSKNPAQEVANALANGAYKKESLDNITALVVLLEEATTDSSSSSLSSSSDSATSPSLYTRSLHSEL